MTESFLSEEDIIVLKRTMLEGFTEAEQESFIRLCQRTQMDPFSKQVYATRRWVKDRTGNKVPTLVPVTSVIGLTAVAVRTGHYNGCETTWCGPDGIWKDEWISEEYPMAAKCIVYHKQREHPEVGIARWAGYCGQAYNKSTNRWEVTDFWERLPDFMLGKCAKAQALRGAFPDQIGNLYASEELQGNISDADHHDDLNDENKVAKNRVKEEELLKAAKAQGVKVVESKPAKKPTPAEAAAPAFPEPPPPEMATTRAQGLSPETPSPKPVAAAPVAPPAPATPEPPDDLDMGEAPVPPEAASAPAGPPVESAKPWAMHEIKGLKNPKFYGRTVGDLSIAELQAIEAQWLPKVRAVWDDVNSAQKADAEAFEAAIAYTKMEKPW